MSAKKLIPVIITDHHRGVYYGEILRESMGDNPIYVQNGRHVFRWGEGLDGYTDLAHKGPGANAKIGPPTPGLIRDVKNVWEIQASALERWRVASWE